MRRSGVTTRNGEHAASIFILVRWDLLVADGDPNLLLATDDSMDSTDSLRNEDRMLSPLGLVGPPAAGAVFTGDLTFLLSVRGLTAPALTDGRNCMPFEGVLTGDRIGVRGEEGCALVVRSIVGEMCAACSQNDRFMCCGDT
jgi:hypothetical protein